jgi:hypothetical protein
MANPIHVAKLTGVLLPNRVYSIPFSTRLGPVPVVTITDGKQNGEGQWLVSQQSPQVKESLRIFSVIGLFIHPLPIGPLINIKIVCNFNSVSGKATLQRF